MDMYRERFRQAQEYADRVLHIKKGHYLDDITAEAICEDETAHDPEIRYWSRLCSYRKMADENRQTQDPATGGKGMAAPDGRQRGQRRFCIAL